MSTTYSQLKQDLAVLEFYKNKKGGYFIEIGASDGIEFSNTYLLEKEYEWKGICVEPIPSKMDALKKNRPNSIYVDKAVYNQSGLKLSFDIANDFDLLSGLSDTICHLHKQRVDANKTTIIVETITLNDMLEQANAPAFIDYISLDVEGVEFEILSIFDFSKHMFGLIDVEHNWIEPKRTQIRDLLISNGYVYLKENQWDDSYKHSSMV
jgi:FkbM family methyltransferase